MQAGEALQRKRAQGCRGKLCWRGQSVAASRVCQPALPRALLLAVPAGSEGGSGGRAGDAVAAGHRLPQLPPVRHRRGHRVCRAPQPRHHPPSGPSMLSKLSGYQVHCTPPACWRLVGIMAALSILLSRPRGPGETFTVHAVRLCRPAFTASGTALEPALYPRGPAQEIGVLSELTWPLACRTCRRPS